MCSTTQTEGIDIEVSYASKIIPEIQGHLNKGKLHLVKKLVEENEANPDVNQEPAFKSIALSCFANLGEMEKAYNYFKQIENPSTLDLRHMVRICQMFGSFPENLELTTTILPEIVEYICDSETSMNTVIIDQFLRQTRPELDILKVFLQCNAKVDEYIIRRLIEIGSLYGDYDFTLTAYNTGYRLGIKPTSKMLDDLLGSTFGFSHTQRTVPLFIIYEIARREFVNHGVELSNFFKVSFSYLLAINPICKDLQLKRIEENISPRAMETSIWIKYADSWISAFNEYTGNRLIENDWDDNFLNNKNVI